MSVHGFLPGFTRRRKFARRRICATKATGAQFLTRIHGAISISPACDGQGRSSHHYDFKQPGVIARSVGDEAIWTCHSGMVRRTRPGISRFRVRSFLSRPGMTAQFWIASLTLAMTALETLPDTLPRSRGATRPSFVSYRPSRLGGRREDRAPDAPAASYAKVKSIRASHHRFTGSIRPSLRNGFNGFLRARPGDRALLSP